MRALVAARPEPRLNPFTLSRPAGMLPVLNTPLIRQVLDALPDRVSAITIVGPDLEPLQIAVGSSCARGVVDYVCGDADDFDSSLMATLCGMEGPILVVNAHDRHDRDELSRLAEAPGALWHDSDVPCGLARYHASGSETAWITACHVDATHASLAGSLEDCALEGTKAGAWKPTIYPWHIIEANVDALALLGEPDIRGELEPHVTIKGPVAVGEDSLIKSGTTIEGPAVIGNRCTIGPCAYIRPNTVIGHDCFIGHSFEVFDSVVFDGTKGKHRSYVGHSVIGCGVNIGCGFVSSDYRHDGAKQRTLVEGEMVDTGRSKLGVFIGDGARTGVNTSMYPGRKIWPGLTTLPGEVVQRDKVG